MTTPSSIEERIARLEGSFEQIDRRLSEVNARLDRVEARIDQLGTRIDRLMYWQLGLLGAIAASIVATVLTRVL